MTNKEMFNLTPTEPNSVGNWDGQEQLAAKNLDRIRNALYEATSDDIEFGVIHELMKSAWDYWGNDVKLLTVTDEQINEYVGNMKQYDILTEAYCELIHSMGRLKTFEKKISEEFNQEGAYFSNPMTYHCLNHLKTAQRELKESFIKFVISGLQKQHKNLIVDEDEIMGRFGYGYNPIGKEDSCFSARDVVACFNKIYDPEKMDQVIYKQIIQTAKKSVATLYKTDKGIERFRKDARGLVVSYNDPKYDASNTNYTSALLKYINIKLKLVLPTEAEHIVIESGVPYTTSWGVIRGYQNGNLRIVFNEINDADEIFKLLSEWTIEKQG